MMVTNSQRKMQIIYQVEIGDYKAEIALIPPTIRTIKFSTKTLDLRPDVETTRHLAFPYTLLGCVFYKNNLFGIPYVSWTSEFPKDDTLCHFPLIPSVELSGGAVPAICFVQYRAFNLSMNEITRLFFQSTFEMYGPLNGNRWDCQTLLRDTFLKSWDNWEQLTREHNSPDFMLDFDRLYENINRFDPITLAGFKDKLLLKITCYP
jgi:hypothetical protein